MTSAPAESAAVTCSGASPDDLAARESERSGALPWGPLGAETWIAVLATALALGIAAFPYLPPGICRGDAGDLQLASATLGIMHPPGYPGFVTAGHLLTRPFSVDPAFVVTVACFITGIVALSLCLLTQVRLGVHPWLAAALVLAVSCHPRIWFNLIEPEVYAPALALLAASAYLLIRYAATGARWSLYLAALLFGATLANRPSVIWTTPFFCLAWWIARRGWDAAPRESAKVLVRLGLIAILPGLYSLGYLLVRDGSGTSYNYIASYNVEFHELPEPDAGWRAKGERLWWHITAAEFRRYLSEGPRDMWNRLRWLYLEFFLFRTVSFMGEVFVTGPILVPMAALLAGVGGVLLHRRCRTGFWLLVGMALGNVVFICIYRIYGLAGDLLPLLYAGVVTAGLAMSPLLPRTATRRRRVIGIGCAVVAGLLMVLDAPYRSDRETPDATAFLAKLDMATLPPDSIICSTWPESTALWYAQQFLTPRPDIEVINAGDVNWYPRIAEKKHRPIFMTYHPPHFEGQGVAPYRNLWRWGDPRPVEP